MGHHIGLYPLPVADQALNRDLADFATAKGTARFRLDCPVPYDLLTRTARALVRQHGAG